jgi:hypothetical protein
MAKSAHRIPPKPKCKLVPPDQEKATLEAIEAVVEEVRRELHVGFQTCYATVPEGMRDDFLFRVAAARKCFSVPPWFLAKLLKTLQSEEAYEPPESD